MTQSEKTLLLFEKFKKNWYNSSLKERLPMYNLNQLKKIAKQGGFKGYTKYRKAELLDFIKNNLKY